MCHPRYVVDGFKLALPVKAMDVIQRMRCFCVCWLSLLSVGEMWTAQSRQCGYLMIVLIEIIAYGALFVS